MNSRISARSVHAAVEGGASWQMSVNLGDGILREVECHGDVSGGAVGCLACASTNCVFTLVGIWLPCTRREGQEILAIHHITIGQAT